MCLTILLSCVSVSASVLSRGRWDAGAWRIMTSQLMYVLPGQGTEAGEVGHHGAACAGIWAMLLASILVTFVMLLSHVSCNRGDMRCSWFLLC